MTILAGIDAGTTRVKGVIIKDDGTILAEVTTPDNDIPKYVDSEKAYSEQNPDDWVDAAKQNLAALVQKSGKKPDATGVSGQMHGLVALDKHGKPLRRAIIWDDRRTDAESKHIQEATGKDVGHFTVAKLLWVKNNEPEVFGKIDKIMLPEDYVAYKLTGEMTTTPQGLSQMRLWDFKKHCLDTRVFDATGIPRFMIPQVITNTGVHGRITREVASQTGLSEGTPIHAKAGDQESAAISNGAVRKKDAYVNSGTSGIIGIITEDMQDKSGRGIYWMGHLNETAIILACTLACGASYKWARDNLFPDAKEKLTDDLVYPVINIFAGRAPAGSGGVIWLPYLKGERSPRDDSTIRAALIGMGEKTPRDYLARAVLEGVAHSFRHCQQVLAQQGNRFEKVRASMTGLLSETSPFIHILADDLQVPIEFVSNPGGCYGVALAAGVGVQVYSSLEESCDRTIKPLAVVAPRQENLEALTRSYKRFVEMGDVLSPIFAKNAEK